MHVLVIDANREPLDPCAPARARQLLKKDRATVYRRFPFTIQLHDRTVTEEDYAAFLEAELLPHLERRYRTLAQREARGVMGASLGGLISFYVALSRPQLFSRVGGQSSALLLEEARITELLNSFSARAAFYLDVGKYEPRYLPAHQRIVARLTALGYPCFFQQLAGGHNWTSWRAHLKDLLTFLWQQ